MIVYRLALEAYKDDLSGDGASKFGGRWNNQGIRMLYTSSSISLSILECLVHFKHRRFPPGYHLIRIDIPKALENLIVELPKLKSSWRHEADYTQYIGDEFILNKEAPIMKVPSVVVPEEFNFLLNPLHKDFKKIKVLSSEALDLDNRLKLS